SFYKSLSQYRARAGLGAGDAIGARIA
ncbi:MAG: hypothetical protein RL517_1410, partial [Pseudomonadota bacterium]